MAPPLRVECLPANGLSQIAVEWADLCARTMETNVFLEPGFALPLMEYVSPSRRPGAMLVWEDGDASRLLALLPVSPPCATSPWIARGFDDEQAAVGTPLLDRDRGPEAFAALLASLSVRWPRAHALVLSRLPAEGPVARMVRSRLPHRTAILDRGERAVLHRPADATLVPPLLTSARRRKELRRQRRRLAELGTLRTRSMSSPDAVADAMEGFLILERRGWKGARGTALLCDPNRAAFAREAVLRMAGEGLCRIDALLLDGEPVAMGIVLTVRGRAYWWKTAYDERFAALSPGVQFAADLTLRQCGDPRVALTDSCAVTDHTMIGRLWSGRMPLVDLAVSLRPKSDAGFERAVRLERGRRGIRGWLKEWLRSARGMRGRLSRSRRFQA